MKFIIEFDDERFRLTVIEANGEESYEEAVPFCSVSAVVALDGKVYGAYLRATEPELDQLTDHPTDIEMVSKLIKVYELGDWPTLKPVTLPVTIVETEFDDMEDEDGEGDEEALVI
jgi:hypothetical protein